jgi:hypothetical protein
MALIALVKMEENAQFFQKSFQFFFGYNLLNFQQNSLELKTMLTFKINFRFLTVSVCSSKYWCNNLVELGPSLSGFLDKLASFPRLVSQTNVLSPLLCKKKIPCITRTLRKFVLRQHKTLCLKTITGILCCQNTNLCWII